MASRGVDAVAAYVSDVLDNKLQLANRIQAVLHYSREGLARLEGFSQEE